MLPTMLSSAWEHDAMANEGNERHKLVYADYIIIVQQFRPITIKDQHTLPTQRRRTIRIPKNGTEWSRLYVGESDTLLESDTVGN